MATGEQVEAVHALRTQWRAITSLQEAAFGRMKVAGGPAVFPHGDYDVQLLTEDIEVFRLAQAAVHTWRPQEPPADLPGGRSYLPALSREVAAVEATDPSGEFLTLRERFQASARRWCAASTVHAYDDLFDGMTADIAELKRVLGPLRAAVSDYVTFLDDQNVNDTGQVIEREASTDSP